MEGEERGREGERERGREGEKERESVMAWVYVSMHTVPTTSASRSTRRIKKKKRGGGAGSSGIARTITSSSSDCGTGSGVVGRVSLSSPHLPIAVAVRARAVALR